jgi:hypothetical protein
MRDTLQPSIARNHGSSSASTAGACFLITGARLADLGSEKALRPREHAA